MELFVKINFNKYQTTIADKKANATFKTISGATFVLYCILENKLIRILKSFERCWLKPRCDTRLEQRCNSTTRAVPKVNFKLPNFISYDVAC